MGGEIVNASLTRKCFALRETGNCGLLQIFLFVVSERKVSQGEHKSSDYFSSHLIFFLLFRALQESMHYCSQLPKNMKNRPTPANTERSPNVPVWFQFGDFLRN